MGETYLSAYYNLGVFWVQMGGTYLLAHNGHGVVDTAVDDLGASPDTEAHGVVVLYATSNTIPSLQHCHLRIGHFKKNCQNRAMVLAKI